MPILETKKLEKILSATAKTAKYIKMTREAAALNNNQADSGHIDKNNMELDTDETEQNIQERVKSPEKDEYVKFNKLFLNNRIRKKIPREI